MAANPMVGARVEPGVLKLLEALAQHRNVRLADVVRTALARELGRFARDFAKEMERGADRETAERGR